MGKGNPLSVIGGAVRSVGQATGLMQKPYEPPKPPKIATPTGPKQYTRDELTGISNNLQAKGLVAPSYLGLSEEMNSMQKRTAYATQAVSGGQGVDKAGLQYYRAQAYKDLLGGGQGPTDIEKQFVTETLGEKILGKGTSEDYLSAIERAFKKLK